MMHCEAECVSEQDISGDSITSAEDDESGGDSITTDERPDFCEDSDLCEPAPEWLRDEYPDLSDGELEDKYQQMIMEDADYNCGSGYGSD